MTTRLPLGEPVTTTPLDGFTPEQRRRLAQIEAAPAAEESFDATAALRRVLALAESLDDTARAYKHAGTGSYDDGLRRSFAHAAAAIRAAVAGAE